MGESVEGVAASSGVHKSTLYRWWADKAALVADALASRMDPGSLPDTGTTRGDPTAWLRGTIANYTASPAGAAMPALIADLAGRPGRWTPSGQPSSPSGGPAAPR
ncbi:TetR/AcrR family transcriptional regulator [Streptomyces sp. 900116325]